MAKVKIEWEEVVKILKEKLKEKYPNCNCEEVEWYKHYNYEGEGGHYDFPTGLYIEELIPNE